MMREVREIKLARDTLWSLFLKHFRRGSMHKKQTEVQEWRTIGICGLFSIRAPVINSHLLSSSSPR